MQLNAPNILHPERWQSKVGPIQDDGGPITFKWHFPRGVLAPRMSGLELCEFLLPHMPCITPFLADQPRVQKEWCEMMGRLVCWPANWVDEVLPWIQTVLRTEEDDLVVLTLHPIRPPKSGPRYFVLTEPPS